MKIQLSKIGVWGCVLLKSWLAPKKKVLNLLCKTEIESQTQPTQNPIFEFSKTATTKCGLHIKIQCNFPMTWGIIQTYVIWNTTTQLSTNSGKWTHACTKSLYAEINGSNCIVLHCHHWSHMTLIIVPKTFKNQSSGRRFRRNCQENQFLYINQAAGRAPSIRPPSFHLCCWEEQKLLCSQVCRFDRLQQDLQPWPIPDGCPSQLRHEVKINFYRTAG